MAVKAPNSNHWTARELFLSILIKFVFCCWFVWAVYIFWILTSHHIYTCKYLLPFSRLSFHFNNFLHYENAFLFDVIPFLTFCFCFPFLRRQIQKNIAYIDVRKYTVCSLLRVLLFQVLHLILYFILSLFVYMV